MDFKSNFVGYLMAAMLILFSMSSINAYRKPPFNGSIFGKRTMTTAGNYNNLDYENPSKSFYAMCEIASDACQAWFPSVEKK
ncbi:SIFamide-related peptide [Daktulosphaira vitifoliae]|uniref:SIFamide-related peptide n=1 Tax=Daktulosphaira vitifoliae TaxID=58002 RepID=UPI0021AA525B|nr:SIFamide-related peptide [Daktulosphaira vitifoliae]